MKRENTLCKKHAFVTIIEFYGLVTLKNILALLP